MIFKRFYIILMLACLSTAAYGQFRQMEAPPVSWSASCVNDTLYVKAAVSDGWHIYALEMPEDGPSATSFDFSGCKDVTIGECSPSREPETAYDEAFGMSVSSWGSDVSFRFSIHITGDAPLIRVAVRYMCCNGEICRPPASQTLVMPLHKVE